MFFPTILTVLSFLTICWLMQQVSMSPVVELVIILIAVMVKAMFLLVKFFKSFPEQDYYKSQK